VLTGFLGYRDISANVKGAVRKLQLVQGTNGTIQHFQLFCFVISFFDFLKANSSRGSGLVQLLILSSVASSVDARSLNASKGRQTALLLISCLVCRFPLLIFAQLPLLVRNVIVLVQWSVV